MDPDDPRTPLLGGPPRSRFRGAAAKLCSAQSWRRRLPITIWLPKYSWECLIRDAIAGITVGLTSIPQGIAYAIIAGLPPQVGLYSSIFPGLVYALFGSCKDITVGPTAILAALLAKYVAMSADFAYLASFLSGCVILLLGILQLGFLLDFISKPVISAFTTAAAMQISASQLRSLFRIKGSSGNTFIEAVINFFNNISSIQLWDTVLGVASVVALMLLKRATISSTDTDTRARVCLSKTWTYVIRARNALVVFGGALLAYCLSLNGLTPFALTGKIEGGLPRFGPPPFSTVVGNETLPFDKMLGVIGPEGLVIPLIAILETIAIAKAFAGSATVDGTQEMLAIGMCNLVSSFCQCMPATGSFTRTALNHASGVLTPAGSIFKASLVLLSVTLLSSTFYFIPRCTLAAVIVVAMCSIVEFTIVRTLYRNSKMELVVWVVTVTIGACVGLEYGILCGLVADILRALATSAHPHMHTTAFKVGNLDCVSLTFLGELKFSCATHIQTVVKDVTARVIVLDGKYVGKIDLGVAENLITVMEDIELSGVRTCLMWNFKDHHQKLFEDIRPDVGSKFVTGPSVDQHILGMELTRL